MAASDRSGDDGGERRKEGRITRIASRYAYYSGRVFVRHSFGPGLVVVLCVMRLAWPVRPFLLEMDLLSLVAQRCRPGRLLLVLPPSFLPPFPPFV